MSYAKEALFCHGQTTVHILETCRIIVTRSSQLEVSRTRSKQKKFAVLGE